MHLTKDLLAEVPLFRQCPQALRHNVLLACEGRIYAPGEDVVREDDIADGIDCQSRGGASAASESGLCRHGIFEAGNYFGDLSLGRGERRTGSVRATTYGDIFVLPKPAFEPSDRDYSEFRSVLKQSAAQKSDTMSALLLDGIVL